jgi:hypothetical protein
MRFKSDMMATRMTRIGRIYADFLSRLRRDLWPKKLLPQAKENPR